MRLTFPLSAAFTCALFAGLCGCEKAQTKLATPGATAADPAPDTVVAMANATPLTWGEMDKRASGYLKYAMQTEHLMFASNRLEEAKTHYRQNAIRAFVYKTLMLEEAAKQNIKLTDLDRQGGLKSLAASLKPRNWSTDDFFKKGPMDEATMRREFEDGMLIDKLLKLNVRSKLKVDEKEVTKAVEQLEATNALKRVKLESVRKQLLEGASFEDTARQSSDDAATAKNGGDLGEFGRGKQMKPIEDAAFSQKVGEIGPVIESAYGYHIVKVLARNPAKAATATTPAAPETVRAAHILARRIPIDRKRMAESYMRSQYVNESRAYFGKLKEKAKIECYLYKDMVF
jgi:parvulin-like peptidyl-prolyl isomerase